MIKKFYLKKRQNFIKKLIQINKINYFLITELLNENNEHKHIFLIM